MCKVCGNEVDAPLTAEFCSSACFNFYMTSFPQPQLQERAPEEKAEHCDGTCAICMIKLPLLN
jgi:hypothetical protein